MLYGFAVAAVRVWHVVVVSGDTVCDGFVLREVRVRDEVGGEVGRGCLVVLCLLGNGGVHLVQCGARVVKYSVVVAVLCAEFLTFIDQIKQDDFLSVNFCLIQRSRVNLVNLHVVNEDVGSCG